MTGTFEDLEAAEARQPIPSIIGIPPNPWVPRRTPHPPRGNAAGIGPVADEVKNQLAREQECLYFGIVNENHDPLDDFLRSRSMSSSSAAGIGSLATSSYIL